MTIKFTLLMCIYEKENPDYLRQCLESIDKQTHLPDEIVIVKDGPLTDELENILANHQFPPKQQHPINVNIIALPENVTLGPARAAGVEVANHEWIAIMDCDDICRPDRFEKQLRMIKDNPELGLIGGQIAEFIDDPGCTEATRAVPTDYTAILRFVKIRSPFNHMTVMFRREAVRSAGNYHLFPWFEDYDLWTRMISNGTICANHPDVLVDARVGNDTYSRRRGLKYIRSEWKMQKQLKALGFINFVGFARNVMLRIPVRLLPGKCLQHAYRKFTRT